MACKRVAPEVYLPSYLHNSSQLLVFCWVSWGRGDQSHPQSHCYAQRQSWVQIKASLDADIPLDDNHKERVTLKAFVVMTTGRGTMKTLFVFDFDHTLIDDNSDTWIMTLCPELEFLRNLTTLRASFQCWTHLMDHVLSLIHRQGRSKDEVLQHMRGVLLYEQALRAVCAVQNCKNSDYVIVSDANTIFIDTILEASGVEKPYGTIITNPAWFDESGRLNVKEYHSHDCSACTSTPNLCKGRALSEYRRQHQCYERVVYVGDGRNDLCPCLQLSEGDVVICREGYPLARLLRESPTSCAAQVHTLNFTSSLGDFIISNLLNSQ